MTRFLTWRHCAGLTLLGAALTAAAIHTRKP